MTRQTEPGDGYEDDGLFRTVMFGYDRAQVDDYVNAIRDELHVLSVAVKRLTPVEEELAAAQTEIRRLQGAVAAATPSSAASARITQMLRVAEEEAAALRAEANEVLAKANQDADEIRRHAEMDTEHVAAARRRENQRVREDIIAGARAEAARILSDANLRSGNLAVGTGTANGHNGATVNGAVTEISKVPVKKNSPRTRTQLP
jgi:cell division septum initiation protein DivIVA